MHADDLKSNNQVSCFPLRVGDVVIPHLGSSAGEALAWTLLLSLPEVRLGEIDQIVAAAAHHGLEHVEREALGHLDRDAGWNRKHTS